MMTVDQEQFLNHACEVICDNCGKRIPVYKPNSYLTNEEYISWYYLDHEDIELDFCKKECLVNYLTNPAESEEKSPNDRTLY